MQLNQILLLFIITIPIFFAVKGKIRMDTAALLMAAALGILQFLGVPLLASEGGAQGALKAVAGFGQPVIITLMALFIISRSLEKSGVTRILAGVVVRQSRSEPKRMIALFAAMSAFLSLFMNNVAAGALVLPSALEAARKTGIKPSKLLIPVSFGSLLGGTATYFTTANIIMSDLLRAAQPPQSGLHILSFTPVGGLMTLAGILFLFLFGDALLPAREPGRVAGARQITSKELQQEYGITDKLWEIRLDAGRGAVENTLPVMEATFQQAITCIAIKRKNGEFEYQANEDWKLKKGDVLWALSSAKTAAALRKIGFQVSQLSSARKLEEFGVGLSEMMLTPHSRLKGLTLSEARFRNNFKVNVLVIKHGKRILSAQLSNAQLAFGDTLLVSGDCATIENFQNHPDLLNFKASLADQPIDRKTLLPSVAVALGAIAASIAGVPVPLSMLAGAALIFLLKIIPADEAYHAIEWQAIFLIAGMYPVSQAIVHTGLAEFSGKLLLSLVSPFGGLGLAVGSFLATSLLTLLIGGQVAALVTGPVAISAALSMGVNPQAIAVATAIGCSASFLTPFAHPVSIIMMAPGNYRFSDFWRVGWPLTVISILMLMAGMKLFWGL